MQLVLVQLLSSIKSMPLDLLIQTIHQVVKQPSLSQVITNYNFVILYKCFIPCFINNFNDCSTIYCF